MLFKQPDHYQTAIIKPENPAPPSTLPVAVSDPFPAKLETSVQASKDTTFSSHTIARRSPFRAQNVNFMSAGFSSTGTQNDDPTSIPSGKMDANVWMRHSRGKKWYAQIMRAVQPMQKMKVPAKLRRILGTSSRKLTCSASLAVAPHWMSISKKWHRRAFDMCRLRPPRKMVKRGIHLTLFQTGRG